MAQKTPLKIGSKMVLFGLGILLPFVAHAFQIDQQNRGETANSFLQVNPSVRAAALGGNQVAIEGHFDSMFSNPAGLASLSVPEVWISHNQSFVQTQYSHIGFAVPHGQNVFAFSANYVDHGKEERTNVDASGQPIVGLGEFRYSTLLAHMGLGRKIGNRIYIGGNVKGWNDKQDSVSQSGWAADAGLIFKELFPLFDLAIAAKNIGPNQNGYKLPSETCVGAALHLPVKGGLLNRTSLYTEFDFPTYADSLNRTGLEFNQRYFRLRAGYETASSDLGESLGNFTFGAGMNIKGWRIDYAWVPKGDLGDQHQVALTIGFGLTPEERAQAAKELDFAMEARLKNRAREYFENGRKALTTGNLKHAEEEFENATVWDPHNMDAQVELNRVRDELQFFEANGYYHQGAKFAAQQQWLDATFYLKKAVKLVPTHEKALALLKRAERSIQKDAQKRPTITLADRQFNLGVKYYLDENYPAALREWKLLLKKAPHQPDLREYIEITYIQGAGEFVYVPNRPRKNLRIFSRKKDAYSGMVYTFVRKAE
jgi:tetratricopeptide (TPR) repeat protein